ncbi:hypothetical protein [uncultured Roseobacter sp.]|uniref:hypothetical protein n=1 Tax=uncultured Roseobacter sp. TaxID=114847 RepID=UPI00260E4C37|nr:hypothetical protein [uncultured Roseobacter sp.]
MNIYHSGARNIGDRMCGPAQYLWPDRVANVTFRHRLSAGQPAIIGGGQVWAQTREIVEKHHRTPGTTLVAWGIALPPPGNRDTEVADARAGLALLGTRNHQWHRTVRFVPCASCLSPVFDDLPAPQHDVVCYLHARKSPLAPTETDAPTLTNDTLDAARVARFLASGDTVVTSSYHGVYWAQLLGRRVVCLPYSRKFDTFEHPPTMACARTWRDALKDATATPPLLTRYREINRAFARDVAEVLSRHG